ncbi:WSC domain-containing protein [Pholiota molesta]|nr:WSC domain-containing protein [Pholiota molesta]
MTFCVLVAVATMLSHAVLALPSADLVRELDPRLKTTQLVNANATDPNNLPANWTVVGCFSDSAPTSRTLLEAQAPDNPAMTPLLDFATPFIFAGTEFASQCFCDFNIQGTATKLANSSCDFPCGGDANLTCGGAGAISVYQNHNANVGPMPANKPSVGSFSFVGCVTDAVGNNTRTLSLRLPILSNVTIETCTAGCQASGFTVAGLEFGNECWCGNAFLAANISAPASECSMACSGDHTEVCGAANRLTIYTDVGLIPEV